MYVQRASAVLHFIIPDNGAWKEELLELMKLSSLELLRFLVFKGLSAAQHERIPNKQSHVRTMCVSSATFNYPRQRSLERGTIGIDET